MSALNLKSETTDDVILAAEHRMAMKPAAREMSSNPGNDMKLTVALKMMAAYKRVNSKYRMHIDELTVRQEHAPITSTGAGE